MKIRVSGYVINASPRPWWDPRAWYDLLWCWWLARCGRITMDTNEWRGVYGRIDNETATDEQPEAAGADFPELEIPTSPGPSWGGRPCTPRAR